MGGAVEAAAERLRRAGVPEPRREAAVLLAWVLGTDRGGVLARRPDPLPAEAAERFESLVSRRERREPFQYLTGREEFCGLEFRVDRRVLVPRPETGLLVEAVLGLELKETARVVDLGTGSGCIATVLAVRRPGWELLAVDRSADALAVARDNAGRHGVLGRMRFLEADLADLAAATEPGEADAVVSNPPYVSEGEWRELAPEVRDHEPKQALVPGPTGLEAYRSVAPAARRLLRPGGYLVLELGWRSEPGAAAAVVGAGLEVLEVRPDPRSIPRVLVARRGAER